MLHKLLLQIKSLLWAFFILFFFNLSFAQFSNVSREAAFPPPNEGLTLQQQVKAQEITHFVHSIYENNQFNGTVMVIDKGKVLFHKAFGWANIEKKDTMTIDTPFRLASVSKQFTAMAIMMLKERGKLSYEDDISQYLPELPYKGITIRNLLNHNSGIPDYFGLEWSIVKQFPNKKYFTNDDLIKYFSTAQPRLLFKPGKKASYSNTGFVFLASIVERISGGSFSFFIHKNIFEPLGMKQAFVYNARNFETIVTRDTSLLKSDTVFVSNQELRITIKFAVETLIKTVEKRRAYGYIHSYPYPNGFALFDYHPFDGIIGEKGICASTLDLAKWDAALYTEQLVSQRTLQEAFRANPVADRKEYKYGFGWKIYTKREGVVFHHGLYRGFRTYFQRDLKNQTALIILSNVQIGGQMIAIQECMDNIMQGKSYKIPKALRVQKDTFEAFKNKYRIEYGGK